MALQISDRYSMKKLLSTANYRDRAKIFACPIRVDCDKSGEHEMCSSVYLRFPRICFADICGCAATLSCQTRTATSRRGDCHRRRSDSKSVEKFSAYHNPIIRGRSFIAALALANADLPQSKIGNLKTCPERSGAESNGSEMVKGGGANRTRE